ncbi:hypothetical protein N8J89_24800 [Crossiella sp. CA-258035]|uniref:AAA family ATPase n=1 Tax=Crossiella sp. CA-258035 TaxID=2981138 RepID=UPI0024BCA73B|nr:AAA family ATPase [Crossiella sp. CA-258035]WHT16349.1 hypothetical protein N8J89_24800 [Crossiella sp. CA-258035]
MRWHRLLITGASGAGTTTLGRALASLHSVPHAEADDYLWLPTSPPYLHKRPMEDRIALMQAVFLPRDSWVLSGSVKGWGEVIPARLEGVVFLTIDQQARMARLLEREVLRYGDSIKPGGSNEAAHHEFLDWARGYDDDTASRSLASDEKWLAGLTCPVLRLDSAQPVADLVAAVERWTSAELVVGESGP